MRLFRRGALAQGIVPVAVVAMLSGAAMGPMLGDGPVDDASRRASAEQAATQGQAEFSDLVQGLMETMPEQVVDFSWQGNRGVVVVAPEGEAAARSYATTRGVKVTVRTSVAGAVPYLDRSSVELAAMETLGAAEAGSLAARYEPATDSVVVTVRTDDKVRSSQKIGQALDAAEMTTNAAGPAITVEYEGANDVPREEADTQGGEQYSGCTGGFVGRRATGSTYGIITSAHCTTRPTYYDGDTTGSTYVASNNRDVRYTVLSGGTPENRFRYDFGSYRAITSTGIVSTGALLFKFGKTTGYGSSTVESYKGCVTFSSGNVWCNLYYTQNDVTDGGDSGGPWFVANKGYAFTTGSDSGGSYITPIAWVGSISGTVTVRTS